MNNKKYAAALKYDEEHQAAPKLLAKGQGVIAENIIKKAKESGVSVYEDERLAKQLQNLEIDEEIPVDLYEAVAEVLSFIARLDQTYKG